MKEFKMNMTRPEFLKKFLTKAGNQGITEDDLSKIVPENSNLVYAMYCVLLESDLERSDITQVHCDGETVVVKLTSKSLAKSVREKWNKEHIRLGIYEYKIKVRVDNCYIFVSMDLVGRIESLYADLIDNANDD